MAGQIEMKLAELGITLPSPMPPIANYVPYVVTGSLVVVSGQVPAARRRHGSASSTCWCI
jgi:enamine deaminase RidA (YjgF/YER057c/UK114 family)